MSAASESCPLKFDIGGMHCAACSSRIERVLNKMPDIKKAEVNLASATALVWPQNKETDSSDQELSNQIMEKVAKLGFTAAPVQTEDSVARYEKAREQSRKERAKRLERLWPMALFSLPLLFVSMGHMAGLPLPDWLNPHSSPRAFILVQFFLTLPVMWLGRHFYKDGLLALWRRSPNMDSLVAVGTGAAFLYSLANSVLGLLGSDPVQRSMNLYYESCAVLLTMIELGQFLEFTAKRKASDAMGALMSLTPESALLLELDDGQPLEIPLQAVKLGNHLLVRPGARIPVDGKVISGSSAVNLSLLTGESMPVPVGPGDDLTGGSVNGEGSLIMEATAIGQNTRLARIIRLVQDAQGSKAPIARLADRVSYYFVPIVMLFAVIAALLWFLFSAETTAVILSVFVAILVMACPCAMGLATPMSIMVGTARGAQLGILIKNGAALEQAGQIQSLCLDKTGTLTSGNPALTDLIVLDDSGPFKKQKLLGLAASLEGRSEHPLGLAIIEAAKKADVSYYAVTESEISPGLGISGSLDVAGKSCEVFIGNAAFMEKKGIAWSADALSKLDSLAEQGQTPLLMAIRTTDMSKAQPAAILPLADQLRDEAPAVVKRLQALSIKVIMLTGDNVRTARAVAAKAGISEVKAGLLPAQKAEFIRCLQDRGEIVGMVGDGLNDAPALALANVGLAVGTGVDVSAEAGDIVLMRGGMETVLTALSLSRAVMTNIKQNLGWAFGYNILGLPIAAGLLHVFGGPLLSPMLAGIAMALSSVSVVTNALRLRFFKVKKLLSQA